jgi:NAD(P)-dependent dehydrogenase (short-subunit alcohol dehydrogenase family)
MRHAASEGVERGVRVNIVAPALVDTPMAARALGTPALVARLPELMPLSGRACTPGEVAEAVIWLASAAASRITGVVQPVDAGWCLR